MTCPSCLFTTRNNLDSTVRLMARLDREARAGRTAYAPHAGIPGGDALVLLSPAATAHGKRGQLRHRALFGLDSSHVKDELSTDPRPPLAVLTEWETRWRTELGQPTDLAPTLDRVVSYLDKQAHVMAERDGFSSFSKDLAALVTALEDVLHDGIRPEITRVPCWTCGARLIKVYAATVSADHWACPRCRETYDRGQYDRAKHDHLASEGADRYVSVADAVAATGRSQRTIRDWMRKGLVLVERDARTLRLTVWWPDVRGLHRERMERSASNSSPAVLTSSVARPPTPHGDAA